MWTIPSRGRPHNLARLYLACERTGMSTPAVVMLDDDDPTLGDALKLQPPPLWMVEIAPRAPLAERYNVIFRQRAPKSFWGFLSDDVVPETPEWDVRLAEVAGDDGLAAPSGGHDDYAGAPHFALGGGLVDEIGWLALPGLSRLYIDTVWGDIARARGVWRQVSDAVLRHHHFSNGLARPDATYRKPSAAEDRALYGAWRGSNLRS